MISVSGLAKHYGPQTLFEGVSFQLNPGNRYGLVGANGSGKSTLLRILSGQEEATGGTLSIPKRLTVGFLEQDHFRYEEMPIIEVAMMGDAAVWEAMVEKEKLLERAHETFDGDRYAELEDVILAKDGYSLEARAGEILEGLGIPTEVHRNRLSTLSGGFKLRVLLAKTLAANPDALMLDEPTNHLDIVSIRWMEKFLVGYGGIAIVVSHDHRFLDNVCNHIIDVDYETAILYPGNYSDFEAAKKEERTRRAAENERMEKKIADHQAFVDRFRAKATKARQAQSKIKMMEKLADDLAPLPPSSRRYPTFRFQQVRPSGKEALVVEDISKAYGANQVLEDVSLTVRRGDRVAIIGPNGIGKSTLLKIAMGEVEADGGELEWGYETYPGYFAQDHNEIFKGSKQSVEAWLWERCPAEPIGFVRGNLGAVLFSGDDVKKPVGSLSGGEGARLVFARLAVEKPNVMVLDEPTNHLDLEAIDALVEGLRRYDGTLLFVSHDRWFVSELADRIIEISPEGIEDFRGSYDEYLEAVGDDHLDADTAMLRIKRDKKARAATSTRGNGHPREEHAERERQTRARELARQRDRLTERVEKAEERVGAINETFCDPSYFERTPPEEVAKLQREQKELNADIEELMGEWEQVETELGELGAG